jgi:hypothetical protein
MSDFLMVVPSDWIEIPNDPVWIGTVASVETLTFAISQEAWSDIDTLLSSMVVLPEGKNVSQARLMQTDTGYRFWVKYA